jgi:hypothetical protein
VDGRAYEAIASAMNDAYGAPMSTFGAGRINPAVQCVETYPDAEVIMIGVEEPSRDSVTVKGQRHTEQSVTCVNPKQALPSCDVHQDPAE